MTPTRILAVALVLGAVPALPGQTKSVVGTVASIRTDAAEIDVQPDSGEASAVKYAAETVFERVKPGEKDLRNASPITASDVAAGDRVLVTFKPDSREARRVVVMPASDIARRNEADRQDWLRRGLSGIVAAKRGNDIVVRRRSFQGDVEMTVTAGERTTFRRYAPDSVKFADAKPSSLAEISPGDQLRARGQKSEDGLHVVADEIVFGTFLTTGGTVTSVDPANSEVTIKDLETNKPRVVRVAADSQLKRMPAFGGAGGLGRGPISGGGMFPGGGPMAAHRGAPDLSQMLERMPAAKLEDLKPGETIVVSSTKGASKDRITAIMLVANAEPLIRMAAMRSQQNAAEGLSPGGPALGGPKGPGGGLQGLEMPGMLP